MNLSEVEKTIILHSLVIEKRNSLAFLEKFIDKYAKFRFFDINKELMHMCWVQIEDLRIEINYIDYIIDKLEKEWNIEIYKYEEF